MTKTIVLSGGHLSPAVAVAQEFKKRGWEVVVIGRDYVFEEARHKPSLEKQMMEEVGVMFYPVTISRFPSSFSKFPRYIYLLIKNVFECRKIFNKTSPTAVLTFGGYISAPVGVAAKLDGVPLFIHDQTIHAGRANRLLAVIADSVFISWEATKKDFWSFVQKKVLLTGNPIRTELVRPHNIAYAGGEMTVYITGGSTGSHAINKVIGESLQSLLQEFSVVHQCGDSHFNDYKFLTNRAGLLPSTLEKKYTLTKYISLQKLPSLLERSHIIVGRSGANTVIEIALFGKPAVFIPLSYSQYNEQRELAHLFEKKGSALVIEQNALTKESLLSALRTIKKEYKKYYEYAQQNRQSKEITVHTGASNNIAHYIEHFSGRGRY